MTIYAQIQNNLVINVIVADQQFIDTLPNSTEFAILTRGGIGWTFDGTNFVAPRPFESWTLDSNHDWQAPTAKPNDGKMYAWNETQLEWVVIQ